MFAQRSGFEAKYVRNRRRKLAAVSGKVGTSDTRQSHSVRKIKGQFLLHHGLYIFTLCRMIANAIPSRVWTVLSTGDVRGLIFAA